MTSSTHRILETIKSHSEYTEKLAELLKIQIPAYLQSIAKEHNLSFTVSGSVPSFNDGDPCRFLLNRIAFKFDKVVTPITEENFENNYEEYYSFTSTDTNSREIGEKIDNMVNSIPSEFFTIVYSDCFELAVVADQVYVNPSFYPEG